MPQGRKARGKSLAMSVCALCAGEHIPCAGSALVESMGAIRLIGSAIPRELLLESLPLPPPCRHVLLPAASAAAANILHFDENCDAAAIEL